MKRAWVSVSTLLACLAVVGFGAGQSARTSFTVSAAKQPLVLESARTITAAELKDYLSFVASDEMEGRADPSRGLDITAKFIATILSRDGVTPAGDSDTYFQRIALRRDKLAAERAELDVAGQKFAHGNDYFAAAVGGTAEGTMVYAGDGWYVKAKNIDAYQGVDPKGKIVIINQMSSTPPGVSMTDLMTGKSGEDWMDPMAYAQKRGAAGLIVLVSLMTQSNPDSMESLRRSVEASPFYMEKFPPGGRIPTVYATTRVAQAIFAKEKTGASAILASFSTGSKTGAEIRPFELSESNRVRLSMKATSETVMTQNVVALVEGSDPALKHEYVALGAHYDHVGVGRPVDGDSIYNGADDDGSGTVALMAMADALAKAPRHPKRSVLFVWHMGEEMGLWGSQYFTSHPTVPIDHIVAQLNIDMIGRSKSIGDAEPRDRDLSGPDELYVIGSKMMSTELGALSEAVNASYLKLSFNYKYDDPKDPEKFFYRSDHINYARKNIPIIFYFTGVHADYHQPGDDVSKIDFGKYEKIARTIYVTMWEIGEMKTRPKVDKPLSDVS